MGLIARVIEAAGIPTVVVSLAREVTMQVKPPRAVYLRFPFGNPLGGPGNTEQQRTIIRDCLRALVEIDVPGTILEPGYRWRREKYGPVDWSELSG